MARIPYADPTKPELAPAIEKIVAERGQLLHLYQMLLHSPPVALGWLNYLTAIRQKGVVSGALRELIIMRVAHVNRAPYEAHQHAPVARREGVTQEQLGALEEWEAATCFSQRERAVLAYTDAMTRNVQVPEPVFAALRQHFDDRETIEITATVAAYNMVSRFLEALQIHAHDEREDGR